VIPFANPGAIRKGLTMTNRIKRIPGFANGGAVCYTARCSNLHYSIPHHVIRAGEISSFDIVDAKQTATSDGKRLLVFHRIDPSVDSMLVKARLLVHASTKEVVDRDGKAYQFQAYQCGPASTLMLRLAKYQITEKQYATALGNNH